MNTSVRQFISILLIGALTATSSLRLFAAGQSCGNSTPITAPPCPTCQKVCTAPGHGTNLFNAYTGNAHRKIVDLQVFGSVGRLPLSMVRYSNTRMAPAGASVGRFGRETVWTHGYQWHLRDAGLDPDTLQPALRLGFPDGTDLYCVLAGAGSNLYLPPANQRSYIQNVGDEFSVYLSTGELYRFDRIQNTSLGYFYRLASFEDDAGNTYTVSYSSPTDTLIRKVSDQSGRWLKFTYQNLGTSGQQSATLATMDYGTTPSGTWVEVDVNVAAGYRYLALETTNDFRNAAPLGVAEIEFYGTWNGTPANSLKIPPTVIFGSDPYYAPENGPDKAFDNNPDTYYRYAFMRNGFVGIDAGEPRLVKHIRFRLPFPALSSSKFEFVGLNENPGNSQAITKVEAGIGTSTTPVYGTVNYGYTRHNDQGLDNQSAWFKWWTLTSVSYPADPVGGQATYTYAQVADYSRPVLVSCDDPRVSGQGTRIKYGYDADTSLGFIRTERNGVDDSVIATLGNDSAHKPKVTYPGGPGGSRVFRYEYYSGNGNLKTGTDPAGCKQTFIYADNNNGHLTELVTVETVNGVVQPQTQKATQYNPNPVGNPNSITYPDGGVETLERDSRGRLTLQRLEHPGNLNFTAQVTKYTRVGGRVTRIEHPDGSDETFAYDVYGQPTEHRMRNGATETNTYDTAGRRLTHVDAAYAGAVGTETRFTYTSRDLLLTSKLIVPNGTDRVTTYEYNDRGQVTKITYPDTKFVRYEYDGYGNQTARIDELGHRWETGYDEFKRRTQLVEPARAAGQLPLVTQFSYEEPGTGGGCCGGGGGGAAAIQGPTSITLPSGKVTLITYDALWRKATETVGANVPAEAATTQYAYDPCGDLLRITDPRGKIWKFTYDAMHRRNSATSPLDATEPGQHTTAWTYDVAGNRLTETRPGNSITRNSYDSMNRLVTTRNPRGDVTTFVYGGGAWGDGTPQLPITYGDNLVRLHDARLKNYDFTYDALNRKTSMIYPGGTHEDWTYDVPGNVATYTTRALQVKTCTYDLRNRDINCSWTGANPAPAVTKTYDFAGRLLTMNSSVSALTYTYDDANHLLSETQDLNAPVNLAPKTVSYTYDADGNRASLGYPGGTVVGYTYTARNQLKDVIADGPPPLASYTYDLAGNRTGKALENGTSTAYAYDDDNRLLTVDHRKAGVSFQRFDYTLDSRDNRASRTETLAGAAPVRDSYTHEPADQLAMVQYGHNPVANTSTRQVNYLYDATGNRQTVTEDPDGTGPVAALTTPYATNDLNQYTSIDSLTPPAYDDNGNLTTLQAKLGDPVWSYTYDAQNRLISGTSNAGGIFAFNYDARNRCVAREINGTATGYIFDDWNLIQDRSAADALLTGYVHGAEVDEIIGTLIPNGILVTTYCHHHDGLGNVSALTDESGSLAETYRYDAFGMVTIFDPSNSVRSFSFVSNRFSFTGREMLSEISLQDYRHRYFQPNLGRWITTDPIRFRAKDSNLYRFVFNGSTILRDPFGLDCCSKRVGSSYWASFNLAAQAGRNPNDKYYHCVASCEIAKQCSEAASRDEGDGREATQNRRAGDRANAADTQGDLEANANGRSFAQSGRDCDDACQKAHGPPFHKLPSSNKWMRRFAGVSEWLFGL